MNVESKIWNFTNTGTKVHSFKGDGTAVCRKSIRDAAPEAARMDYCQVKQSFKSSMCTRCEDAFNLAIEIDEAHPAAGTYYPAAPGARTPADATTLVLQREIISAVVYADGSYTVFAGVHVVSKGQLDGTEGQLMVFFAAEALAWSAGIDEAMAVEAEAREERMATHRAEMEPVPGAQTLKEIITMVDALGGEYTAYVPGNRPSKVSHRSVLAVLRDVPLYLGTVRVQELGDGSKWLIRVSDATDAAVTRYMFVGH